jgi:hypothetical protein
VPTTGSVPSLSINTGSVPAGNMKIAATPGLASVRTSAAPPRLTLPVTVNRSVSFAPRTVTR